MGMMRKSSANKAAAMIMKRLGMKKGDVPKGHFVVYVGINKTRYILPISCLGAPQFQILLQQAQDEFGFHHFITIPCDDHLFQQSLLSILN